MKYIKLYIKSETIRTPSGMKVVKIPVPSVYDKILELYKTICIKNKFLDQLLIKQTFSDDKTRRNFKTAAISTTLLME
jgi:hypothetical protein